MVGAHLAEQRIETRIRHRCRPLRRQGRPRIRAGTLRCCRPAPARSRNSRGYRAAHRAPLAPFTTGRYRPPAAICASPLSVAAISCAGMATDTTLSAMPRSLANSSARSRSSPAASPSGPVNHVVAPGRSANTSVGESGGGGGVGGGTGAGPQAVRTPMQLHRMNFLRNSTPMDDALNLIIAVLSAAARACRTGEVRR